MIEIVVDIPRIRSEFPVKLRDSYVKYATGGLEVRRESEVETGSRDTGDLVVRVTGGEREDFLDEGVDGGLGKPVLVEGFFFRVSQ